jgi:hypothetical protein
VDAGRRDPFPEEVLPGGGGGGEVEIREDVPVSLRNPSSGKGLEVAAAESGLHVPGRHMPEERGERREEDRGGVPLDQDQVGGSHSPGSDPSLQAPLTDLGEGLPLPHDSEVQSGSRRNGLEHLVHEFRVLSGEDEASVDGAGTPSQGTEHRGHLDGFGAGPHHDEHATRRGLPVILARDGGPVQLLPQLGDHLGQEPEPEEGDPDGLEQEPRG